MPPVTEIFIFPLLPPKQDTFVTVCENPKAAGSKTVLVADVFGTPLLSVTFTL